MHLEIAGPIPFVGLIASMAIFPLAAPRAWARHQGKIAAAWAALVVVWLLWHDGVQSAIVAIADALLVDYLSFIVLLLALFTTAGGIVIRGNVHGRPLLNLALIAIGAAAASAIGTTGASMLMIRPLLRANDDRRHNTHVVVFFIFLVSNIGGCLTPLGDPPLFLGFLHGVSFGWPATHLFAPFAVTAAIVLAVFFVIDTILYRREGRLPRDPTPDSRLGVGGLANVALIAVIVAAVPFSEMINLGEISLGAVHLKLGSLARDTILLVVTFISIAITPAADHEANGFEWGPIKEVAKLFAAIFVTLVPVMAMLRGGPVGALGSLLVPLTAADGSPDPLAYFWLTGALSSFLDNAPTYVVFFGLAGGDADWLMNAGATTLAAISLGAVFMGANTYIGNGPNFMVYAIARDAGVKMPSFFGYMKWSGLVLVPTFAVVSLLFFV